MLTLLVSCGKGKEETKTETAPTTEVKTEEKTSENAQMAKKNPFLSAEVYGITHFDSSQSDSFPYAVKTVRYKRMFCFCRCNFSKSNTNRVYGNS